MEFAPCPFEAFVCQLKRWFVHCDTVILSVFFFFATTESPEACLNGETVAKSFPLVSRFRSSFSLRQVRITTAPELRVDTTTATAVKRLHYASKTRYKAYIRAPDMGVQSAYDCLLGVKSIHFSFFFFIYIFLLPVKWRR
jgi:hypothetical protein